MRTLLSTRLLTSDDGATVDAVFAGLSERSRYLRFHTAMPRLTGSVRRSLLDVDGHDRAALVAEVPGPAAPCRWAWPGSTAPAPARLKSLSLSSTPGRGSASVGA